jgi:uncharacterized Fe-S cluster-containing protein
MIGYYKGFKMKKRYQYITDEMLERLDKIDDNHFKQQFFLMDNYKLSKIQSHRVIRYWRETRYIEKLEAANI